MNNDPAIATAADYADALLTARRGKNLIVLLILLMLLTQIGVFLGARYTSAILPGVAPVTSAVTPTEGTTQPSVAAASTDAAASSSSSSSNLVPSALEYATGAINFLSIVLALVLAAVLYLIVKIMLVGRLIGVSLLTSAWMWGMFLAFMLFPWQAFLHHSGFENTFKVPGVLYTWSELVRDARFSAEPLPQAILKWARFVGFPVLAVIVLLMVQAKSNRGLRQALGEDVPGVA
jgi:hypothetical protein